MHVIEFPLIELIELISHSPFTPFVWLDSHPAPAPLRFYCVNPGPPLP